MKNKKIYLILFTSLVFCSIVLINFLKFNLYSFDYKNLIIEISSFLVVSVTILWLLILILIKIIYFIFCVLVSFFTIPIIINIFKSIKNPDIQDNMFFKNYAINLFVAAVFLYISSYFCFSFINLLLTGFNPFTIPFKDYSMNQCLELICFMIFILSFCSIFYV